MQPWSGIEEVQQYGRGILAGKLVRFRPLHEEDLAELERWWTDPEWSVLQSGTVRPRPADSAAELFRGWSANKEPGNVGFSVVSQADDTLVGHVVLYGAAVPTRSATAAIIIGSEYAGRGFGTDAMRTLVRYGFEEMGLNRIGLEVWAFNDRAIASYLKAGFVEEGRRREMIFHAGRFHDEVLMSILAADWRAAR
jgi:RimJ/RimL family protein N-acetyltransferase